ncbi:TIGR03773 family transporter-associated surface protein [Actinoplanes sp. RD1]|uniref:TIGR03773 family transporter-associated surface protein n=1 Tax=Actinoplanes sp. RD1 TaxID=3064538 RepID=UPI0035585720
MQSHAWRVPTAAAFTALMLASAPAAALAAEPVSAVPADGADLMSVSVDGDRLSVRFRDAGQAASDATGTDPAAISLGPEGGLTAAVPNDPAYAFLGEPGRPVWSLSAGGSRFPALDLTDVRPQSVAGGKVQLRLVAAEGPGDFAMYTVDRWGRPTVLIDSDARTSTQLPAGRRLGGLAWTFGAAGDYRLTFAASATTGGEKLTRTTTYAVDVPAMAAAPAQATPQKPPAAPAQATPQKPPAAPAQATAQRPAVAPAQATAQRPAVAPAQAAAQTPAAVQQEAAKTAKAQTKVIDDGHVDMGPQLSGSAMTIRIKDDTTSPPVWRELSGVVLKASDKAKIPVPAGTGYAFLGKAGDDVWLLPQTQQSGIVWPGWNTQHESVISGLRGNVTWSLKGVSGPGAFKLFLTSSFGTPDVLFDSAKALPQQLSIPLNTHAHGNWAFTKAGLYRLAVQMSATTRAGKTVTDTKTLTIAVGDSTSTETEAGAPGTPATTGPAAASGASSTPDSAGGALARTGANIVIVAGGGLLLVLAGFVALRLGRRRTPMRES